MLGLNFMRCRSCVIILNTCRANGGVLFTRSLCAGASVRRRLRDAFTAMCVAHNLCVILCVRMCVKICVVCVGV